MPLAVISFDENRGGIYLKERMNTVRQSAFPINVRIHFNMLSDLVIDVLNPSHSASVEE
ncbi:hypothetical protein GWK90_06920 [Candidatus Hamiltonella defensa]|nr:hypothetical protein [Candidatus Hamiltonella defensa]MBK4361967.1 hypothetical protein [Candidatus Hamiltonella defensa]